MPFIILPTLEKSIQSTGKINSKLSGKLSKIPYSPSKLAFPSGVEVEFSPETRTHFVVRVDNEKTKVSNINLNILGVFLKRRLIIEGCNCL